MDSTKTNELFDPDPLSMCMIPEWVGMDFGKPVALSQIRYLPRNDANGIFPDNQYELFYYDFPQGWISMGIKRKNGVLRGKTEKHTFGDLRWRILDLLH